MIDSTSTSSQLRRTIFALPFACLALGVVLLSALPSEASEKRVILEVFTASWCGWCPDGAVTVESILAQDSRVIPINVHIGDAMENADSAVLSNYFSPAFPQAVINRRGGVQSRNNWPSEVEDELGLVSTVSVNVRAFHTDGMLQGTIEATFLSGTSGDLRVGILVTEDHVTGVGSGYNQTNYMNNTPGHPYFAAGDPIIGYDHRYLLRDAIPNMWGQPGVIQSPAVTGDHVSWEFQVAAPSGNAANFSVVGFVSRYDGDGVTDRRISNAALSQVISGTPLFYDALEAGTSCQWSATVGGTGCSKAQFD